MGSYDMKSPARCLAAVSDEVHHSFLVSTANLRGPNEIRLLRYSEEDDDVRCAATWHHNYEVCSLSSNAADPTLLATAYSTLDERGARATLWRLTDFSEGGEGEEGEGGGGGGAGGAHSYEPPAFSGGGGGGDAGAGGSALGALAAGAGAVAAAAGLPAEPRGAREDDFEEILSLARATRDAARSGNLSDEQRREAAMATAMRLMAMLGVGDEEEEEEGGGGEGGGAGDA